MNSQVATTRTQAKRTKAEAQLDYLRDLKAEALRHEAVHHPYLTALSEGEFSNPREALRDFAKTYQGYSAWFPRFLSAVEARLPKELQGTLAENKAEEVGSYDEETLQELEEAGLEREWIDKVPHPELFRRFQRALNVEMDALVDSKSAIGRWREELLQLLETEHPAAAVGALGLGTELVVSRMYASILEGVDRFGRIHPEGRSFLVLHALVDDAHAESLLELSRHFATTGEGRAALARGMRAALDMRADFWSELQISSSNSKEDAA